MKSNITELLETVISENQSYIEKKYTIADFLLDAINAAYSEDEFHDPYLWYLSDDEVLDYKNDLNRKRELQEDVISFIRENYSCNYERIRRKRKEEREPEYAKRFETLASEIRHYLYSKVSEKGTITKEIWHESYSLTRCDDGETYWIQSKSKNVDCEIKDAQLHLLAQIVDSIWIEEYRNKMKG